MKMKNYKCTLLIILLFTSGCATVKEYATGILEGDREGLIVYKSDKSYEKTQFDLEVPPDLITPSSPNAVNIPDYAKEKGIDVFTVDTKLDNIELVKSGRDSFLSLKNIDRDRIWKLVEKFWRDEGFRLEKQDFVLGTMQTGYLENLSEAQLGTIQRVVGRYVPLLVSPDTRDSYKTRFILGEDQSTMNIMITHYGKEYMSDGDTEFRWQNRARDIEFESEMISRLYIFLGGDEAKSKGFSVIKSTGLRGKASMNVDDDGLHTLFVNDIFERVWPKTIRSLETMGLKIISADEGAGVVKISIRENEKKESGFLDKLAFWSNDDDSEFFSIVLSSNQQGTTIEVQNDAFINVTSQASEEVMRGLYAGLR